MTMTRRIGAIAALGGMMTAAAALLTGLPSAQADELSQLRANQALLQQKLDQLEQQAAAPPAAALPPGAASLAGSFPRSILIPGTNTSLEIGGFVQLDAAYWFNGGNPNDTSGAAPPLEGAPVIAGLALRQPGPFATPPFNARSRSNGIFRMQADESRFFIETRTPTAYGEALTHLELDMFGCAGAGGIDCSGLNTTTNGNVPRLRLAYGSLGPWLAGQDWGPTNDLESSPTLFDFGGDVGILGAGRLPQLRYTAQLPYGQSLIVAAVQPTSGSFTPQGAFEEDSVLAGVSLGGTGLNSSSVVPGGLALNPNKSRIPDGNFVWRLERPWGNLQVGAVLRDLTYQDGRFVNKDFIGYGGQIGVHMVPFPGSRDNFGLNMFAGDGLGHYAAPTGTTSNTFFGIATNYGGLSAGGYGSCNSATAACFATNSAANAAKVIATTVTSWGAEGNYQHWWKFAPGWRSTVSAGIQHQDVPTTLVGLSGATVNFNKELISAHLNLMWSPVAFVNTGIEWTYGHRHTIWNQTGNENVLDFALRVTF